MRVSRKISNLIQRSRADFKRETFRCGGKGGQKQNKTETGVRITDLITGISCEGREHRTQIDNQKAAFERLVTKMVEYYQTQEDSSRHRADDRVVRTYNEKRGEVKCESTGTRAPYQATLDGDLDLLIKARLGAEIQ